MEQPTLFGIPGGPRRRRRPGRRFLTETRQLMAAVSRTPTLRRILTAATEAEAEITGQEWGTIYEQRVAELLADESTGIALSEEACGLVDDGCPVLEGVDIVAQAGRAYCDFLVLLHMADETRTIPVNLKTTGSAGPTSGLAVSLASFVRLATEEDWDPLAPPSNNGYDVEAAILEWVAGERKVVHGRDYYVLTVQTTADRDYVSHQMTGLLSTVTPSGQTVVSRHTSRANVLYHTSPGDRPLPDNYDINAAVSVALLPRADLSLIRAAQAAWAIDGGTDPRLAAREALRYVPGRRAA